MAYQNFFAAKLDTDIGSSDTTITLDTAPSATSGRMVLEARNPTQREVIKYTGVAGTQITGVTRGQGGTSAKSHTKNSLIEMNMTAEDLQDLYDAYASFIATNNDWRTLPYSVGTVVDNTNHSYTFPINGIDLTSTLSAGMRLRLNRTTAAPAQCASLDGTTQYFQDTSVSGHSFTNNFVVSAYIKVDRLLTTGMTIASRTTGTNGWIMTLEPTGQILILGYNGSASNARWVTSRAAVPIGKWVHVTAQLDMASYPTVSPTTSYTMIDGVNVTAVMNTNGTNPTSFVQAGNLEIGSQNGGNNKFPGKIAQVAIYSAKVTQANVRATMHQALTGSETNIAGAYTLSNSLNDLSANANHLTAQGGATTTNADSPFGNNGASTTAEYGIIMKKPTFSTNTSVTVQVPAGCAIPTSGSIANIAYSSVDTPFGFPKEKNRWNIDVILGSAASTAFTATNVYDPSLYNISVPIGAWKLGYSFQGQLGSTVSGARNGGFVLGGGATYLPLINGKYSYPLICRMPYQGALSDTLGNVSSQYDITMDVADTFNIKAFILSSSGSESFLVNYNNEQGYLKAENAYL